MKLSGWNFLIGVVASLFIVAGLLIAAGDGVSAKPKKTGNGSTGLALKHIGF